MAESGQPIIDKLQQELETLVEPIPQYAGIVNTDPRGIMNMQRALQLIVDPMPNFPEYSLEMAQAEKPHTHYTNPGNIFQILRFGIQSNYFKTRLNDLRASDPRASKIAPMVSGMKHKKGGSYQRKDSISLSAYSPKAYLYASDAVFFIDPNIETVGSKPDDREKTGYGHGIRTRIIEDEFYVGNETAYKDELLAINFVPPQHINGVLLGNQASILGGLRDVTTKNVKLFLQARNGGESLTEDLLATPRLIASMTADPSLELEIIALAGELTENATLTFSDVYTRVSSLQRKALSKFVGDGQQVNESSLREAMQQKFGLKFLSK